MKRLARLLFMLVALAGSSWAAPSGIGFLPEEKVGVTVPPTERNPFGKRVIKAPDVVVEEKGGEEAQIRDVVAKLVCHGLIRGAGKTRILLGSFLLEEGATLPPVIANQSEKLKVVAIQKDRVDLAFVDKDGKPDLRKISVLYDIAPNVHFKLEGNESSRKKAAELGGVYKKNDPASSAQ